jgi:hypothetical protein
MNSVWIHNLASPLASSVDSEPDAHARVRTLYRKILSRDPNAHEMDLAVAFLDHPADPEVKQPLLEQYAQILLSTNEEIFWP